MSIAVLIENIRDPLGRMRDQPIGGDRTTEDTDRTALLFQQIPQGRQPRQVPGSEFDITRYFLPPSFRWRSFGRQRNRCVPRPDNRQFGRDDPGAEQNPAPCGDARKVLAVKCRR